MNHPPSFLKIMRHGEFRFYWFPGVTPGVYRTFYGGWMCTFNLWLCSFEWTNAWPPELRP